MKLHEKVMLVTLNISMWQGQKLDRSVTNKVNSDFNAATDAGKYNKALIAKENLKAMQKIANAARAYHYFATLPWLKNGACILPSANFTAYSKRMREFESKFQDAVENFKMHYEQYIQDAKFRLNGMFNPDDYPAVEQLNEKFRFSISIMPLPVAEDFRVQLANTEIETIQNQIQAETTAAIQGAVQSAFERLTSALKFLVNKMNEPGKKGKSPVFRDSLIGNIKELADIMPALNFTENQDLADITAEIQNQLAGLNPEYLRNSETARTETAKKAKSILEKIDGIY